MIVYRQQRRRVQTRELLHDVQEQIEALGRVQCPTRDRLVHALIDAGEWAAGVADARAPEREGCDPVTRACLDVVVHLAAAADASWCGRSDEIATATHHAGRAISACERLDLPATLARGVSEGFAYYGVGPELYAEAARSWAASARPQTVWCIGLRTIGLSLAASAAAALQARGISATTLSIRPRGHPFDRRPMADASFERGLLSVPGAWVIVIDEGPGISGSSIAGTARWLSDLGIASERIVLMPAYRPDVTRLSDGARAVWQRHAIHAADFDTTWIRDGRLAAAWGASSIVDVSAGKWREVTNVEGTLPAVHPHHERRKYVARRDGEMTLAKFAGLGRYGESVRNRAAQAADEGWSPAVRQNVAGWIEYPWVSTPFGLGELRAADISRLAQYLSFVARTRRVEMTPDTESLTEMTRVNTTALCGDRAARAVETMRVHDAPPVFVDGRLRPHEWVRLDGNLQKTDGVEHGDDHFFPGPCDIAWDVAAAIEEWKLESSGCAFLLAQFVAFSGDRTISQRLMFYRIAYLAFRAAYTAFSRDQLGATPDGVRFHHEHDRYRRQLETVLRCAC